MEKFIASMSWELLVIGCLTLGLAPFSPPHIFEKITMLINGTLKKPIDIFDLVLHSIPWALLALKVFYQLRKG